MLRKTITALSLASFIAISGCSESAEPDSSTADAAASDQSTSAAWVLTQAPTGDISITEAKANAKEGDQIIIRGRIGGRSEPISAGSPVFTVVDLELPYCGQFEDDSCPAPWDYCCETPETIASNSATVQVIGSDIDLGAEGFEPLDEIILIGTVGPRPDDQVLTVLATGVFTVDW